MEGKDDLHWRNFRWVTLPKTNIAPENRLSQKESSIPYSNHPFSGAMLVSGRVSVWNIYLLNLHGVSQGGFEKKRSVFFK